MTESSTVQAQIHCVENFQDLVSTPFRGKTNAVCWVRKPQGDFSEIVNKVKLNGNITVLEPQQLLELNFSEQGQLAREILLNDFNLLTAYGASPVINLIKCYERDDVYPFFPTDVYSFHVDRSPIPTDTFLCTYYGAPSEILPNAQAVQKISVPEIRNELKKIFDGPAEEFDSFLTEHFFDLHYQPETSTRPFSLGVGNMWKLAVDHPDSKVLPCIHRAPNEKIGETRLLMIC